LPVARVSNGIVQGGTGTGTHVQIDFEFLWHNSTIHLIFIWLLSLWLFVVTISHSQLFAIRR